MVKEGNLDILSQKKLEVIREALNELKAGDYPDTTGGAQFYVHASDGTLWLGKTSEEAKSAANSHEKEKGIRVTKWGTAMGAPVREIALRP